MNSFPSHSLIIWLVIAGVVLLQLYFAVNTIRSIRRLKRVFPNKKNLYTLKKYIPEEDLREIDTDTILKNYNQYDDNEEGVTLIGSKYGCTEVMKEILQSINTYLLRNRGAVADFNLIRDITDRNVDAIENEIDSTLPVPLYLGLAGTMLGIIIGLLYMPPIGSDEFLHGNGLDILIGGVKIAMFSTLAGLIITIFNTSVEFKKSKARAEKRKNDFFTFIQTELLPVLTENAAGSIYTLDRNLKGFNRQFRENTLAFAGVMSDVGNALQMQKELYRQIESTDVPGLAKHNLNLFKKFEQSAENLEKFGFYLDRINMLTQNSDILLEKTGRMLENSDTIAGIAVTIKENVRESNNIIRFIESHFAEMEYRKDLIRKAVSDVDSVLNNSFENLGRSVASTIDHMRRFTEEEIKKLEAAFSENSTALSHLNVLPHLQASLNDIKLEIANQGAALRSAMEHVNESVAAVNSSLPLNAVAEKDSREGYTGVFRKIYFVSGALVFSGICVYTGIHLVILLIDWLMNL
jgi:hypothetical protein